MMLLMDLDEATDGAIQAIRELEPLRQAALDGDAVLPADAAAELLEGVQIALVRAIELSKACRAALVEAMRPDQSTTRPN